MRHLSNDERSNWASKVHKLMSLIRDIINDTNGPGTWWSPRRDAFLAELSEEEKTDLFEFSNWFIDDED